MTKNTLIVVLVHLTSSHLVKKLKILCEMLPTESSNFEPRGTTIA